jgi:iron complex transport system permease protein
MKALALGIVAMTALVLAVLLGPAHIPVADLATSDIVRTLRLPRAILAFLVGGALALSGAGLQALVRNPLADPSLLGISGGAGLGAVVAIALHVTNPWAIPLAAFAGALGAMALVYRLGVMGSGDVGLDSATLLLAGVAVGAFAAAVTTAIVSLSDAAQLRNAQLWLWGGLSGASWQTVALLCVYTPLPALVLAASARSLDLLALGEEPARHLGVDARPVKRRVYVAASLLTAAAVAVSGVIGFVGLVVPHAMRLLWGHRHRPLFPAAFVGGGALLALSDTAARVAVAPRELPVGIVTALVGVPVFVVLLRRWTTS